MTSKLRPQRLALITLVSIAIGSPNARATVFEVPGSHDSISAAIAAAVDGDTILVAPGTYTENINFAGKAITVTGHYEPGGSWSLVENTIIDGSESSSSYEESTVIFRSGEGRSSVLQGFTITGGRGTQWVDPQFPDYRWRGGGGVFIFGSSPTICHCVVSGNRVSRTSAVDGAGGGGVLSYDGNPLIQNTIITANLAQYGGGLVVDYSGAEVRNTIISHNSAAATYGGGGIWTIGSSSDSIELTNCSFVDNSSQARGGALYVWESIVTLRNSLIWDNQQTFGSAIYTTNGGRVDVTHSDVEGGAAGAGNIDLDPRFVDSLTYHLGPSSPCTDAGDQGSSSNDPEDPTSPGNALWPATGGLRNDMGAYGGPWSLTMSAPTDTTLVFIPAAAVAPGAAGSFFVTDVEVNNLGTEALSFRFLWLPRDADNAEPTQSAMFSLAPGAGVRYGDVLGEVFEENNALGALAVEADGDSIAVMSRTYNLTDDGTFGQALPGIPAADLVQTNERVRVLFMTENLDFRSNLGLLNGVDSQITVEWELHSSDGALLDTGSATLPALGNTQVNRLFRAHAPVEAAYVDVWTPTDGAAFTCYGSVIDSTTNDPTTVLPQ